MTPVTDPALLEQLDHPTIGKPVTDPALLSQLEGGGGSGDYWGDVGKNAMEGIKQFPSIMENNAKQVMPVVRGMAGGFGEAGTEMVQGTPFKQTHMGQALNAGMDMAQGAAQGAWQGVKDTGSLIEAPFQSGPMAQTDIGQKFKDRPFSVPLGVASTVVPALEMGRAGLPLAAQGADAGAMALGRRSLGFTKRFLNTEGKELNANAATRTALDEGIIKPFATAEGMRESAKNLQGNAGDQMGSIFEKYNTAPPQENAPTPIRGPMKLLPPGRTPSTVQGPEGQWTNIEIPAYGGSGRYQYQASGERPQFGSTEGPTSHPVQKPETINKALLNKARQGKLGSSWPEPKRQIFQKPEAPPENWLFDTSKAINDLDTLRPKTKSGQVLRGGDYSAQNEAIDTAIETIKAHGNRPIPWDQANQLKSHLQGLANYDTTKSKTVNSLRKSIGGVFKDNLDEQLANAMVTKGENPSIFGDAKKKWKAAHDMQSALQNRISSEHGNNGLGLTDYLTGTIGGIVGGHFGGGAGTIGALGSMAAKKFAGNYGPSTGSYLLNKTAAGLRSAKNVTDMIHSTPAGIFNKGKQVAGDERGSIFPESALPPGMRANEMFTPSEQKYKVNELNEQQYLHNNDFPNAMKAKWGMANNTGGNVMPEDIAVPQKALTEVKAREFLKKAKGDKALARKLATGEGWSF